MFNIKKNIGELLLYNANLTWKNRNEKTISKNISKKVSVSYYDILDEIKEYMISSFVWNEEQFDMDKLTINIRKDNLFSFLRRQKINTSHITEIYPSDKKINAVKYIEVGDIGENVNEIFSSMYVKIFFVKDGKKKKHCIPLLNKSIDVSFDEVNLWIKENSNNTKIIKIEIEFYGHRMIGKASHLK